MTNILTPPEQYPIGAVTENFHLPLGNLVTFAANALVALDAALANTVALAPQGRLQAINVNTPQSTSATAPTTSLYTVSVFVASYGDGALGAKLVTTISWTDTRGVPDTLTLDLPGNASIIQMEQFPILVGAGQTITVALTFSTTTFHYDVSCRIVQMP
jgi:hypothetical protein